MNTKGNDSEELFGFKPHETTDRQRIMELLAPIVTSATPSSSSEVPLVDEQNNRFTSLGKAVVECLAVKATEFPFLRIFHIYKKRAETRCLNEYLMELDSTEYYPSDNAVGARKRLNNDRWNDTVFLGLLENKNGEVASTCMIVDCPGCKGTGKVMHSCEERVVRKFDCRSCNGTGYVGLFKCEKCSGRGWSAQVQYPKVKREGPCNKCHGKGKVKSVYIAQHSKDDDDITIKWASILEHEPKLHRNELSPWDLNWDRLEDERFKKAAGVRMLKKISVPGGVIDPSQHDLKDLPLVNENDLIRVIDATFPKIVEKGTRDDDIYARHLSGYFRQLAKRDDTHEHCFDEEIRIAAGTGWVKIDCEYNTSSVPLVTSFWFNVLTGETADVCDRVAVGENLSDSDSISCVNMPFDEYPQEVQNAIKTVKKRGIPTATPLPNKTAKPSLGTDKKSSSGTNGVKSAKKRWIFVVLGLLLGFFGIHLAYAKRWFLFLMLWAGFITGNVMSGPKKETTNVSPEVVAEQVQSGSKSDKESSNPISNIGFAVWGLLWIGGTLFIKKDGKGNRM